MNRLSFCFAIFSAASISIAQESNGRSFTEGFTEEQYNALPLVGNGPYRFGIVVAKNTKSDELVWIAADESTYRQYEAVRLGVKPEDIELPAKLNDDEKCQLRPNKFCRGDCYPRGRGILCYTYGAATPHRSCGCK